MKKFALIFVFVLALACLISCGKKDGGEEASGTNTGTTAEADMPNAPFVDPKKYEPFYSDDTVYHTYYYTGYSIIFDTVDNDNPFNQNVGEVMLDMPGEAMYLHEDPTCRHSSFSCPMRDDGVASVILVVTPENRELPLIYFFTRHSEYMEVETVDEDGNPTVDYERTGVCEVREYDVETGEVRTVGKVVGFGDIEGAWLWRGKFYMQAGLGAPYRFCSVDLLSGESKCTDYEGDMHRLIGITNGRLWYTTDRNTIGSCAPDLTDFKDEYDVGTSTARIYGFGMLGGIAENGKIYFERNARTPEVLENKKNSSFYQISDMYVLDAGNIDAGETLAAEDVLAFTSCDGDLYYTKLDYKEFGETSLNGGEKTFMIRSYDGGTLYKYDSTSEETTVCYSDIGVGIENDRYPFRVVDGYVIFYGLLYRDFEKCRLADGRNYICMANVETGEWECVYAYNYILD